MAKQIRLSTKHLQISSANTVITTALAIASFVTVASLVGARAMLQQRSYQAKVITEKEKAAKTLRENIEAAEKVVIAYKEFVARPENIIGGSTTGTGERDGDNAKLILDALPSKYDFPAITTSLEKILTQDGAKLVSLSGSDDEVVQSSNVSVVPKVVEIPFRFGVSGSYDITNAVIARLEHSIRPIQIQTFTLTASNAEISLDITAKTFYQSEKKLTITTEVVK